MTGSEFREIRLSLLLTQRELAAVLGYRHKIRISEFERSSNPSPVPRHIADAMRRMYRQGGRGIEHGAAVREWTRVAAE